MFEVDCPLSHTHLCRHSSRVLLLLHSVVSRDRVLQLVETLLYQYCNPKVVLMHCGSPLSPHCSLSNPWFLSFQVSLQWFPAKTNSPENGKHSMKYLVCQKETSTCISIALIYSSLISLLVGCIRGPGASSVKDVHCEIYSLCHNYRIQRQHKQDTGEHRDTDWERKKKGKLQN